MTNQGKPQNMGSTMPIDFGRLIRHGLPGSRVCSLRVASWNGPGLADRSRKSQRKRLRTCLLQARIPQKPRFLELKSFGKTTPQAKISNHKHTNSNSQLWFINDYMKPPDPAASLPAPPHRHWLQDPFY